jgi:hypothetical protein
MNINTMTFAAKELPAGGLRRIWPVASLLVGYSPTLGDAPSSRLATGQIGRNERHRIYVHDHQGSLSKKKMRLDPAFVTLTEHRTDLKHTL